MIFDSCSPAVRDALREFVARHGGLTDDAAVYGLADSFTLVPHWLTEPAEVSRRVVRKTSLDPDVSWRVVTLLQLCAGLVTCPAHRAAPLLRDALRASVDLAEHLPDPLPPVAERRYGAAQPAPDPHTAGQRTNHLQHVVVQLAGTLDDPDWTDPDVLAGLVDDAMITLVAYAAALGLLNPPRPRSRPRYFRRAHPMRHRTARRAAGRPDRPARPRQPERAGGELARLARRPRPPPSLT